MANSFNFNEFKNGKLAVNGLGHSVKFICETRGQMLVKVIGRFGNIETTKMNLDGKSDSYINAAYDIAKQSFHERKSTNDQRERIAADKVRKDAKEVSNSTSARKKMIANMTGGRK